MNNQLIEKVIKTHYKTCPQLNYENPLIDREVANALSKSLVAVMNLSSRSNLNSSLRYSVLNSIRRLCQTEPVNHIKVNENITDLIIGFYLKFIADCSKGKSSDKELDRFLIRNLKELNLSSNYECPVKPDVLQSLLNLNEKHVLEMLTNNFINLAPSDTNVTLLKHLWNNNELTQSDLNDLSIKNKSEIECLLLNICHKVMTEKDLNLKDLFETNTSLYNLTNKCSKSSYCFQICCNIFNCLLVESNFNFRVKNLIPIFIAQVKSYICDTIAVLYSKQLSPVVLLMDVDINSLPDSVRINYIQKVVILLEDSKKESNYDVLMLLSHYPDWFPIYFSKDL